MATKLKAGTVRHIFVDCLFMPEEDRSGAVEVDGLTARFGLHPVRLESHRAEIGELLSQLPDQFHESTGGGWSFLMACDTADGVQWGDHQNVEELLVLGVATKQAKVLLPREVWRMFPGGVPYFSVSVPKAAPEQARPPSDPIQS